uniref:Plectin/eS10 N-terminal domain-containing protein n=1 Tax=Malurus cyaneus samueli TaxID=2593467 RepID=A0A8C5T223_9PASS
MLMPKKNRIAIYELLFKEGVMVAKKDVHMPKHPELVDKNVPNLHVMKAMQSLKSRGYVKEQFAWRHFYWYLTNEGIQYLRDYLHLPPEIVPATLRRSRPETGRPRPKGETGMGTGWAWGCWVRTVPAVCGCGVGCVIVSRARRCGWGLLLLCLALDWCPVGGVGGNGMKGRCCEWGLGLLGAGCGKGTIQGSVYPSWGSPEAKLGVPTLPSPQTLSVLLDRARC